MVKLLCFLFLSVSMMCCADYELSPREKSSLMIKKIFAEEMRKKGLDAVGFGGAERDGKTTQIALSFRVDEYLEIQKARKLIVDAAKTLLHIINTTEDISQYFKEYPVKVDVVDIAIYGKEYKESLTRYLVGAHLYDGKIDYFGNNPDPEKMDLVTVHEESFAEALALVKKEK